MKLGIAEVLTIVFVILKLVGIITWSWWLVLLPEIIAVILYIVMWIYMGVKLAQITKKAKKSSQEHKQRMKELQEQIKNNR